MVSKFKMGKRNKEPQVGRRRPMIQLGGSSQKSGIGVVSRNAIKEEEKENKKEVVPDEMEDQLAGFLAEINSLDDGSGSSVPAEATVVVKKTEVNGTLTAPKKPIYDVETFDPATQAHLLPENWSAIYDEGSAYYYYWNTVTNEVQWFPPGPPTAEDPPPPPPPMEEVIQEETKSLSELSEENGFHNHVENSKKESKKSNKCLDKIPVENNIDSKCRTEDTVINHNSPDASETYIKDDDIVVSYPFTPEYVNDKYSILETDYNQTKFELPVIDVNEKSKHSDNVVDKYAELETLPQYTSKLLDGPSKDDLKNDDNIIDPYSIIEPTIEIPVKIVAPEEKQKLVSEATNTKDKDKELMSKIKEKIQRKKEEKLRKEKELSSKLKGEDLSLSQKTKEEMLREKLIKKKYEREKALTSQEVSNVTDDPSENALANAGGKKEDLFSVDMFACEEIYEKTIGSTSPTPNTQKIEIPLQKPLIKAEEPKKVEKKKEFPPKDVVDQNSTKERGGWRIIDAVYDDDDDEDEESDNAETEEPRVHVEEVVEKGKGEMDDYAEMLLEETIVDKDKEKRRSKSKRRKSKKFVPALPLEAPPPPPPEPENPPLPPDLPPLPPPEAPEEDVNVKEEIKSISSTLLEKMNVLGILRGEIGKLQQCLLELETRMHDWMAGALESKYFLARLKEVDMEVLKHETAPAGWISHWSSNFKMYYYYNTSTGTSQWDYPTIIHPLPTQPLPPVVQPSFPDCQPKPPITLPQELKNAENDSGEVDISPSVFTAPPPPPPPEASTQVTLSASAASLVSPAHGFSRDPLPEKPTKSRKRTVLENEKSADPYRDPYRLSKKKKEAQISQSSSDSVNEEGLHTSGSESGTASPLPSSVITSGPVLRDALPDVAQDPTLQSYVQMTPPPPPPMAAKEAIIESVSSPKSVDTPVPPPVKTKVKKKKKVEGLAPLKKLRHVSTLVQKWQTVKQQVEDEENVEEESDEDYEQASERRITEWKKEMEYSDQKNYNANFEEIKGDWRARLKRKNAT